MQRGELACKDHTASHRGGAGSMQGAGGVVFMVLNTILGRSVENAMNEGQKK